MEKIEVKVFNNSGNDLPNYETEFSAGLDVKADFTKLESINDIKGNGGYIFDKDDNDNLIITLEPQGRILIPTNLHTAIPDGYEIQIRPRSGLALKNGITFVNGSGTIDCVPKGTLIKTLDGDVPVEMIYDEDKYKHILSYDEEQMLLVEDKITDMWIVDNLELVNIELIDGSNITIPTTKKVYTKRGWITVIDLLEDDCILTF